MNDDLKNLHELNKQAFEKDMWPRVFICPITGIMQLIYSQEEWDKSKKFENKLVVFFFCSIAGGFAILIFSIAFDIWKRT